MHPINETRAVKLMERFASLNKEIDGMSYLSAFSEKPRLLTEAKFLERARVRNELAAIGVVIEEIHDNHFRPFSRLISKLCGWFLVVVGEKEISVN